MHFALLSSFVNFLSTLSNLRHLSWTWAYKIVQRISDEVSPIILYSSFTFFHCSIPNMAMNYRLIRFSAFPLLIRSIMPSKKYHIGVIFLTPWESLVVFKLFFYSNLWLCFVTTSKLLFSFAFSRMDKQICCFLRVCLSP